MIILADRERWQKAHLIGASLTIASLYVDRHSIFLTAKVNYLGVQNVIDIITIEIGNIKIGPEKMKCANDMVVENVDRIK